MQWKAFDKSVNQTPKVPFLSTLFLFFNQCNNSIFGSKAFSKSLLRLWEGLDERKQRDDLKKTGFIFARVIIDGNCEKVIASLKLENWKLETFWKYLYFL